MEHKITLTGYASPTVYYIACERHDVEYTPGNCMDITNPSTGNKRPYSIASSPKNKKNLEFYIRVFDTSPNGISKYLSTLKRGDSVDLSDPFGFFTPGKDCEDGKYIYMATGTGIAPFLSALDTYKHSPYAILYGAKTERNLLEGWRLTMDYNCKIAISQEHSKYPKHVSSYFNELPTEDKKMKYYLCGLDAMIDEASAFLTSKGVTYDQIQTEQFYQSTD